MSHFRQIQFKAQKYLLLATLGAMGLQYTEHPEGARLDTVWREATHGRSYADNERIAHIVVDRESLRQRSEIDYRPRADVGFVLNDDGTYSPIIDEFVCRGKNEDFGQQLAQTYFELAVQSTPWEVVSTVIQNNGTIKNTLRKRQQVRAW